MANVYLEEQLLMDVANAIRAKTGEEDTMSISEMATKISEIQTGGSSTDDATATAADIVSPKTAYIATGKVAGTLEEQDMISETGGTAAYNGSGASSTIMITKASVIGRKLLKNGGTVVVSAPTSQFGTAQAEQVISGATFTSTDGFKVTGTMQNAAEKEY